ncbi:hypothetical protein CMQ_29 [Grosmannia clavigera kw1407]|uniref:DUF7053 domain-containing protein n=1 Tax=Grosmannia clavigera (strain kw1407 / UAMH 11150) TaxID=655863 RepID=F0XRC7_GROCL|nr:uncharacterized protein CMQ_29 [Grosmannia clavigera kw1407]EFW99711.1 hypothetical protein CMQ_29 [Grosmannia clavigera kw1407]
MSSNDQSVFNTTATLKRVSRLPPATDRDRAVRLLLHDHDFFVHCGPHSVEWEAVPADEEARLAEAALDADAQGVQPLSAAVRDARMAVRDAWAAEVAEETEEAVHEAADKCSAPLSRTYNVTDVVHTLPAGIWDSRVVSTYEMTNLEDGVFVRVRCPLSIVMDTTWSVEVAKAEEEDLGDELDVEAEAQDKAEPETKADEQPGALELHEEIVIYCSRLLIGTVKSLCENGWQEIHKRMIARLDEAEDGGGREKGRKGERKKEEVSEESEESEEKEDKDQGHEEGMEVKVAA